MAADTLAGLACHGCRAEEYDHPQTMSRLARYGVTVFLLGALAAGWLGGGAGAAVGGAQAPTGAVTAELALAGGEPCQHRYQVFLAKQQRLSAAVPH